MTSYSLRACEVTQSQQEWLTLSGGTQHGLAMFVLLPDVHLSTKTRDHRHVGRTVPRTSFAVLGAEKGFLICFCLELFSFSYLNAVKGTLECTI